MSTDNLGTRMKKYEAVADAVLMSRVPVAIRVDGKSFSNLTKQLGLNKPYDSTFRNLMDGVMLAMCKEIQGCVLGYAQSDEISLIIRNDQSVDSQPYFGNRIQKIASVAAGMASAIFTRDLLRRLMETRTADYGVFDARVYTLPDLTEAGNYLVWRQFDCTRNSISSAAYYKIAAEKGRKTARKMMFGLKSKELQELMFQEVGANWNSFPARFKRGTVAFREPVEITTVNGTTTRTRWRTRVAPIISLEGEGRDWLYASERLGDRDEE